MPTPETPVGARSGGRDVVRGQIEHLVGLSATQDFFLQVIPLSSGAHAATDLPFGIMSFPDLPDPDVACIGYPTGVMWIEDVAEITLTACSSTTCTAPSRCPPLCPATRQTSALPDVTRPNLHRRESRAR